MTDNNSDLSPTHLPYSLWCNLVCTQLQGFQLRFTKNEFETAQYLIRLTTKFSKNLSVYSTDVSYNVFQESTTKTANISISDLLGKQLIQLKGVSATRASSIVKV